jgi:hypothetical protein
MTLRTRTIFQGSAGDFSHPVKRNTHDRCCLLDECHHVWISQAVVYVPAFPVRCHPAGFPQSHQVLRDGCLAQPEHGHQVTHTGGLFPDDEQDLYARWLAELTKQGGNVFFTQSGVFVRIHKEIITFSALENKKPWMATNTQISRRQVS